MIIKDLQQEQLQDFKKDSHFLKFLEAQLNKNKNASTPNLKFQARSEINMQLFLRINHFIRPTLKLNGIVNLVNLR